MMSTNGSSVIENGGKPPNGLDHHDESVGYQKIKKKSVAADDGDKIQLLEEEEEDDLRPGDLCLLSSRFGDLSTINSIHGMTGNHGAPSYRRKNFLTLESQPKIIKAIVGNNLPMVKHLISGGGEDINATDLEKRSLLHLSAAFGHRDITQLLINNGARIDAKSVYLMMFMTFINCHW